MDENTELKEYRDMLANPVTMVDRVLFELCEEYCKAYDSEDVNGKRCAANRIDQYVMGLRGFDLDG